MPRGLITRLLVEAEVRGKDSVGVAFRGQTTNYAYKQVGPPRDFVKDAFAQDVLGQMRRSNIGIAHTRRASPNMPIDEENAHPFNYWRYLFAHNGKVENWKEIKPELVDHFDGEVKRLEAEADNESTLEVARHCAKYVKGIQTDSMVLGPYIHSQDFSLIDGCMALVWMIGNEVYTFRSAKEAVGASIIWSMKKETSKKDDLPAVGLDQALTLVASTKEIVTQALEKLDPTEIEFDVKFIDIDEGQLYRLEPDRIVPIKRIPVHIAVEDTFSSEVVS